MYTTADSLIKEIIEENAQHVQKHTSRIHYGYIPDASRMPKEAVDLPPHSPSIGKPFVFFDFWIQGSGNPEKPTVFLYFETSGLRKP